MFKKLFFPASVAIVTFATPLAAKEGPDQYPNGAETFMSGALPPPGNYMLDYLGHFDGDLQDDGGRVVQPGGKHVHVDATFDALRFVHVTDLEILGASYAYQAIVPVVRQSLDIAPLGGRRTVTGLGDVSFDPIILGWHLGNLHVTTGLDIYLPTGRYDKNDPRASIGANYYTFEPVVAASYLSSSGFEASAKLMYDVHQRNSETHYRSGNEMHADYLLGYHFGAWSAGLGGYVVQQLDDDNLHGLDVRGSRAHALAIGPDVAYTDAQHRQFVLQWDHETSARNHFQGDTLWLRFIGRL